MQPTEVLRALQIAAWLAFIAVTILMLACYLFPSMRGPNFSVDGRNELAFAAVTALLAIALRPSG